MLINILPNPTFSNKMAYIDNGPGMGNIIANWTGLQQERTYYVRAYASNLSGISYGADFMFTTLPVYYQPLVITYIASQTTKNSTRLSGEVKNDYYAPITERGFIWGADAQITTTSNLGKITVNKTNNSFVNAYEGNITGLTPFTNYYFKSYAINSIGTGYGAGIPFTTLTDGYTVSGAVTYAQYTPSVSTKNMYLSGSKKMPFTPWVKLMQNGVKVDSVMADTNTGAFTFNTVADGIYTIVCDETHAWTPSTKAYQLNIQDVNLIRQSNASARNFDSLQIKAVNVNLDYKNNKPYFNIQDVNFIRMKNGGVTPSPIQWAIPNWVYAFEISPSNALTDTPAVLKTDMTITVNGAPQTLIIRCISAADVNGQ